MITPTTVSMIRDIVAIFGVIAGLTYYVMTVQNQNRTRKAQMLITLQKDFSDYNMALRAYEIWNWEWKDFDDFDNKYGSHNVEETAKRYTDWFWYNNIGLMLKNKLLEKDTLYDLFGTSFIITWERWEPIIKEYRLRTYGSTYLVYYEFLADQMRLVHKNRNIAWESTL